MRSEALAETFVELVDTLVDDFDVHDLLYVLVARCVDLLGMPAAGLLLADEDGQLRLTVSSNEAAHLLDLFQLQNDEGPCLDCYHSSEPVGTEDLGTAIDRWPRFVPAATAAGYSRVWALPLRLRGNVIGALNLFGDQHRPASVADLPIAQAMADVATIAILQHRLVRERELLAEQLQMALTSRVAIEQAKGVLATRLEISTGEAFELLRSRARSRRRALAEVAEDVARGNWRDFVRRSL